MARLGVLDEQQGYRDGPVFLRFPIGNWSSAYLLAIGIVARLLVRERIGKRRAGAHEPRPGRARPDGDALAARGDAVAVARGRDAEEQHHGDAVRVRRRRVDPPDGRTEQSPLMNKVIAEIGDPDDGAGGADGHAAARLRARRLRTTRSCAGRARSGSRTSGRNDVPVQPAVPLGEILQDEQSRANDYVHRPRRPGRGADHRARPAAHDHAAGPCAERRTRARRAHRRGARRVETAAARARAGDGAADGERTALAARGREGARPRELPRRSVRCDAARRPRRRRDQARVVDRRSDARRGVVVRRLPTRASAASRST